VSVKTYLPFGDTWVICPHCNGKGRVLNYLGIEVVCPVCGGLGRVRKPIK
jgi:DnaJ-class molecular chaperone